MAPNCTPRAVLLAVLVAIAALCMCAAPATAVPSGITLDFAVYGPSFLWNQALILNKETFRAAIEVDIKAAIGTPDHDDFTVSDVFVNNSAMYAVVSTAAPAFTSGNVDTIMASPLTETNAFLDILRTTTLAFFSSYIPDHVYFFTALHPREGPEPGVDVVYTATYVTHHELLFKAPDGLADVMGDSATGLKFTAALEAAVLASIDEAGRKTVVYISGSQYYSTGQVKNWPYEMHGLRVRYTVTQSTTTFAVRAFAGDEINSMVLRAPLDALLVIANPSGAPYTTDDPLYDSFFGIVYSRAETVTDLRCTGVCVGMIAMSAVAVFLMAVCFILFLIVWCCCCCPSVRERMRGVGASSGKANPEDGEGVRVVSESHEPTGDDSREPVNTSRDP